MHVLLCGIVPPQGQDLVLSSVEFHELISPSCTGPSGVSASYPSFVLFAALVRVRISVQVIHDNVEQ